MPRGIPAAGKRAPGAGRPKLALDGAVRVTVTLTAEQAERLRALGKGNASAGVRALLNKRRI